MKHCNKGFWKGLHKLRYTGETTSGVQSLSKLFDFEKTQKGVFPAVPTNNFGKPQQPTLHTPPLLIGHKNKVFLISRWAHPSSTPRGEQRQKSLEQNIWTISEGKLRQVSRRFFSHDNSSCCGCIVMSIRWVTLKVYTKTFTVKFQYTFT